MTESFEGQVGDTGLSYAREQLAGFAQVMTRANDKLILLEAALNRICREGADDQTALEGSYGYIPLEVSEFFDCLFDLEAALVKDSDYADPDLRHRRVDFVEAGCGPGRNAFLAQVTDRFEFRRVHGFDICAPMIDWGRQVLGMGDALFVADCATFDYSGYDVIYFYRPFSDMEAEAAFEDHLVSSMRSGAYVIGCGQVTLDDDRRLLRKDELGRVFKKLR